jgi:hypothetical protein
VINTADINAAIAAYRKSAGEFQKTSGPIQPELLVFRPRDDTPFGGTGTGLRLPVQIAGFR